jgi:hypothetical protein
VGGQFCSLMSFVGLGIICSFSGGVDCGSFLMISPNPRAGGSRDCFQRFLGDSSWGPYPRYGSDVTYHQLLPLLFSAILY